MRKATVYIMRCPITNNIRYVGSTVRTLEQRFKQHRRPYGMPSPVTQWIYLLEQEGLSPVMEAVAVCELKRARALEYRLITYNSEKYKDYLLNGKGNPYRGYNSDLKNINITT